MKTTKIIQLEPNCIIHLVEEDKIIRELILNPNIPFDAEEIKKIRAKNLKVGDKLLI